MLQGAGESRAGLAHSFTRAGWTVDAREPALVLTLREQGADGVRSARRRYPAARLVALSSTADEGIAALEAGADCLLPDGWSTGDLVAAVSALSCPCSEASEDDDPPAITLHPGTRHASVGSARVRLTRIEFQLLEALLDARGAVVPRSVLLQAGWGEWFGKDHVIEVHLSRLRRKIIDAGSPTIPVAVTGMGYRMAEVEGVSA